jgi:hypothetical protein
MDPAATRALARLREADGAALRALARLVVEETTATPVRDLATPRWIAGQIATSLEAISHGEVAREWVDAKIKEGRVTWTKEQRVLRTWMPKEAEDPLRQMLARPYSPDERLAFRVLDQPAVRSLVRDVLEDTLVRFQRRLRSLDRTGVGSLGARAARKGRGFLGDVAHGLGGVAQNLGGLTENIVGAVTEELESVLRERIQEFVKNTTGEAIKQIAKHAAEPKHADAFGELRVAILDVILDTPLHELVAEADKLKPEELVDVVIGAIRSTIAAPDFVDTTEARVAKVLETAGDGTLGAWLDEVALRAVWTDTTTELVAARLQAVVRTERFTAWWEDLFRPEK